MPTQSLMGTSKPAPGGYAPAKWFSISLGVHLILIAIVLYDHTPLLKATQLPGDLNGHRLLLTYLPGQEATSPALPNPTPAHPVPDRLPALHAPNTPPPASVPSASLTSNSNTGTDTLGQGDIQIASMLVHPRPEPDLTALPTGTRGDVIVDIVIDTNGRVAKTTMEHGLGHGVDETVLATVQQWTFQPATRNGIPVASEQELLFHYERG